MRYYPYSRSEGPSPADVAVTVIVFCSPRPR